MRTRIQPRNVMRLLLAAFLVFAYGARAGIPEPGIILYGKVLDAGGALLTSGEITWSFSPESGGDAVEVTVPLRLINGIGGPYSYRALVPLEAGVDGFPVSSNALEVLEVSSKYTRTGEVAGQNLTMTHNIGLSTADIGSAKRVDLCFECGPETKTGHTADVNKDFYLSEEETIRVLDLYRSNPAHEYHNDPLTYDGFAPGPGPHDLVPHSSDFLGGVDWRFSLSEVLRTIDLFDSTPDGAYAIDDAAQDGFDKFWSYGAPGGLVKDLADAGRITVARVVQGGAATAMQPMLTFTLTIAVPDGMPLSALGVEEVLPAGWRYAGVHGPNAPAIGPIIGKEGALEFTWFPTPAGTIQFSYDVINPAGGDTARAYFQLYGRAAYRVATGSFEKSAPVYAEGQKPFIDVDGDGVPEMILGIWDTNGDGIADHGGTIFVDSNGDGLPDFIQRTFDTDGDLIPDVLEGVWDSDSDGVPDFLDSDSDNDHMTDRDEQVFGTNPLDPFDGTEVPAHGPAALALLASLVALAGARSLRKSTH